MQGVALSLWDVPEELIRRYQLTDRITSRGKEDRELQFLYVRKPRLLPVWCNGQLRIVRWEGWCPIEELEAGAWSGKGPLPVEIPASFCFDRGIWYQVKQGVKAVVVRNQVFAITQPSSHYYRVMTRNERMPVLIGEEF